MQGLSSRKCSIKIATAIIPIEASKKTKKVLLGSLIINSISVLDPNYPQLLHQSLKEHLNLPHPS